jgi:hypothetical protein
MTEKHGMAAAGPSTAPRPAGRWRAPAAAESPAARARGSASEPGGPLQVRAPAGQTDGGRGPRRRLRWVGWIRPRVIHDEGVV